MDAGERFAALVEALTGEPDVVPPAAPPPGGRRGHRFGAAALRVNGSIFAMHSMGAVVLKLPADRVAALIASGDGLPFGTGKSRPMREWVMLPDTPADDDALAREALEFVRGRPRA